MTPSLYDQLGGEPAIGAVVDKFYRLVLADPALAPVFQDTDTDRLRAHQKAFVTMALGGPNRYTGRALTAAHAHLAGKIDDATFDKVVGHLARALSELGVTNPERAYTLEIVGGVRDQVLGRAAPDGGDA